MPPGGGGDGTMPGAPTPCIGAAPSPIGAPPIQKSTSEADENSAGSFNEHEDINIFWSSLFLSLQNIASSGSQCDVINIVVSDCIRLLESRL